ncbi:MAG TPA: antitoxin Xre/MbcA/ParS toxin-binding domain-containing protein [Candidatus Lustribacter sp.]
MRVEIASGKVTGARVRALRQELELTLGDVAHVLGASERSVMRKEQGRAALSVAEGDRAYRLARVADLATELIGNAEHARRWLKTPHRYLGDQTPIAMLDTEIGTDLVIESLYAVAYGGVA